MSDPVTQLVADQQAHFEALYAASSDPWNVKGAWYEQRKRTLLLACLHKERYASAFEPGCGNGELTAALAQRCERILACDGAASAIAAARPRIAHYPGAVAEQRHLPQDWPEGDAAFDLIVVSEMAYYLPPATWQDLVGRIVASLAPGGLLLMCHCRYPYDDYATSADFVHGAADARPELTTRVRHVEPDFLLDGWLRAA